MHTGGPKMFNVDAPLSLSELRIKDRFLRRDYVSLYEGFFQATKASRQTAVVIVSHSGTISNMLFSHTDKVEEEVLKPRNASIIAIDDTGSLGLQHEGTLPECKSDEWHEYFTVNQFEEFADGIRFDYSPPRSCLLLLVRHGIALNNVNKAYSDGNLTREGEVSFVKAALRMTHVLQKYDISTVSIFSSACMRTRHSSELLYGILRARQHLSTSRSLPCLLGVGGGGGSGSSSSSCSGASTGGTGGGVSCGVETAEAEEAWKSQPCQQNPVSVRV